MTKYVLSRLESTYVRLGVVVFIYILVVGITGSKGRRRVYYIVGASSFRRA